MRAERQLPPKVLVTGAAGFIGSAVVREFVREGWRVTALVHRRTTAELQRLSAEGRVIPIPGDVADLASLEGAFRAPDGLPPAAVVHGAGRASDVGWERSFRRANLLPVQYLVALLQRCPACRLVVVSTTDVYGLRNFRGEGEDELPCAAQAPNPYPRFKIAAEEAIRTGLPPGSWSILRPAAVWGVGDRTLTSRVVGFLRWSPWIVHLGPARGRNRWPLAHVRNVAAAAFLAATRPEAAGKAINVLDSEVTSVEEWYRLVAGIFLPNRRFQSLCLPLWFGWPFAALVTAVSNALNLDRPIADPSLYALATISSNLDFSNRRFLELMAGARRRPVTRAEGLEELAAEASAST